MCELYREIVLITATNNANNESVQQDGVVCSNGIFM